VTSADHLTPPWADLDAVVASEEYARFCEGTLADPYPLLRWLREHDPVHRSERLGVWLLTRYEDVHAGLLDRRLANDRIGANLAHLPPELLRTAAPLAEHISNWLGFTDPPKHTRLRALLRETFKPNLPQQLDGRIREIAEELIEGLDGSADADLIGGYALPLPALVICDILGLQAQDTERFGAWSEDMVAVTGHVGPTLVDIVPGALRSYEALDGFIGAEVDARRGCPAHDLLGRLAEAEQAQSLDRAELIGLAVFTLVAGHETTANLLGTALRAALTDPDLALRLRAEPELWGPLTEEILRLEAPIQFSPRVASEALEIGGTAIGAGDAVVLHLGAANRDPRQFPAGDGLDLGAATTRHLAFAWGPHFCLGAPLARAEAAISLPLLFERLPQLELLEREPRWRPNMSLRGLTSLRVRAGHSVAA
jgi:cytochrome P450